jgi:beta-glucanase (GH16 family)
MRRSALPAFALGLVIGASAPAAELPKPSLAEPADGVKWTVSFDQTFNGGALDRRVWTTELYFGRTITSNGESQWYADDSFEPQKDALHVVAQRRHVHGKNTSGVLTTAHSFTQTYGFFEMRARLPAGKGLWSAFWLLPENHDWPPEIDVVEMLGHEPQTAYLTAHFNTPEKHQGADQKACKTTDLSQGFHNFGVDWEADAIIWYVDGTECFRTSKGVPHVPMYLLANLAVGGKWPGQPDASTHFPASLDIAWIRAWKRS